LLSLYRNADGEGGGGPNDTTTAPILCPFLSFSRPSSPSLLPFSPLPNTGVIYAATQTTRRERIQTRHKRIRNKVRREKNQQN